MEVSTKNNMLWIETLKQELKLGVKEKCELEHLKSSKNNISPFALSNYQNSAARKKITFLSEFKSFFTTKNVSVY